MNTTIKINKIAPKLNKEGKQVEGVNQWGGKWQLFTINDEYDIFSTLIEKNRALVTEGNEIDIDYTEGKWGKTIDKVFKVGGIQPAPSNGDLVVKRLDAIHEGIMALNDKIETILQKNE